jgi:hypothetical protein
MRRMGYHGYTGGLIGLHVRWVTDGNSFGWQDVGQLEFGTIQPQDQTQPQQTAVTGSQQNKVPKGQVVITVHGLCVSALKARASRVGLVAKGSSLRF